MQFLKIGLISLLLLIAVDVLFLRPVLGLGYPRYYLQENWQRAPAPYIAFKGKPDVLDHDRWGYRKAPGSPPAGALRVAFFGGSTGYLGDPPIAALLETELAKIAGRPVAVRNFSVVSSNHRQHLHNVIETHSIFEPDLVIFYGGYNETVQSANYDPRPGYPFNFFFREETSSLVKTLLQYSAIAGLADMAAQRHIGASMTPIMRLRAIQRPFSDEWNRQIVDEYFETLDYARRVASGFAAPNCGRVRFVAVYQPFAVPDRFKVAHQEIRRRLAERAHGVDLSALLGGHEDLFVDGVHLKQEGNARIASALARALGERAIFDGCASGKESR